MKSTRVFASTLLAATLATVQAGSGGASHAWARAATAAAAKPDKVAPPGQPARPSSPMPTPALGDYLAASAAMQANDFAFSAEHMLRALAADPRNRTLRQQAFLATALAGRPEAARLASGLPGETDAVLAAGNELAIAGRWGEAEHAYAGLPHDGGVGDALRPVLVAWSQYGAGHADAALAGLAPLAAGTRLPSFYALNAALIADAAGRGDEAASDYHLAQSSAPGLNLALVRMLASFEARHGHLADGEALVHALLASVPTLAVAQAGVDAALADKPVAGARAGLARAYLGIASLIDAEGHETHGSGDQGATSQTADASALLMLRYASALDPGWSETRLVTSDVEQSMHDPEAALAALQGVRASDPLAALVALREAELDEVLGRDDAARALYAGLVRQFPGIAAPSRALGELLNDEHRYGEAIEAFDRAIADIRTQSGDDWQIYFDRAVAFDRSHQWNRAEADLRHALALSPEQPFVLNYLGYSYAEQGRNLDEARRMLERALDQKPHDGAFLDSLGWIILKQGHVADAIDQLQDAAELTPEDPTVNYHLGVAYWQAGRHAEAQDQWQRALILNPDADEMPKIEARLHEASAAVDAAPGSGSGPASPR